MTRRPTAGFTLIELLVTLALVGLLALVSLPLYDVTSTRMKEEQLREALRAIRTGLDAYKAAVDTGALPREAGQSGYPPSLDLLTQPLDLANKPGVTFNGSDAPHHLVIMRQLPRDPFFPDPTVPAAQTWRTRAYGTRSDDPEPGDDVYDISSMSPRVGLDGIPYSAW